MANSIKIGKRSVDALKATGLRYVAWDNEVRGFGVRVGPTGSKTYVLKYRVGGGREGRVRWGVIGPHGALTPDQARETAQRWAAAVATGGDPAGDKLDSRKAPTVSDLLDRYLSEHAEKKNKARTEANARALINKLVRPALGKLKVADVTRADVAKLHNGLSATPYQANRALAVLSKAFNLAEVWGLRTEGTNPCMRVERFEEKSRERFLTDKEFATLGEVMARAEREPLIFSSDGRRQTTVRVNPEAIRAVRLLIFTGGRVGEILGLRWEYIDLEAGRANLPDSKTGKKVLQLPPPALEVLSKANRPKDGKGFVIRGGGGADPEVALVNLKDPWGAIRRAAGLEDVRPHDLRHAFASVAVARGISLPMIGALLGHREVKTTQRYAHLADDPQKAAAGQIANRISEAMTAPTGGAEVVQLGKKR